MASPSPKPAAALIAGGGIAGLALALALARLGRPSIVVERRPEWSEAGAGIQISPNGVRVLELLGVRSALAPLAGLPEAIVVRSAHRAEVLQRLPLGAWIEDRHGAPYWQVHRRDLQAALVEAVSREPLIRVEQGFDAASFNDENDAVTLADRSGRTLVGAWLAGADGVFSRVRQQLWAPPSPRFSGLTAARAVVPRESLAPSGHGIDWAATGVWLTSGAHVVHYPVRAGREIALVVVRTEAWSSHGWSAPIEAAEIETWLAERAPFLAGALGRGHDWRRWALFQVEPLPRWSRGLATLLGDAAHPTLPFFAQGGVMALEDAVTLAHAVASSSAEPTAIRSALSRYDQLRSTRTRRIVDVARRNGRIFHLSRPVSIARDLAMRAIPGERVMKGFDWVYGWTP